MEKNCYVEKYKESVQDNSLLKLGEMMLVINSSDNPSNNTQRLSITGQFGYLEIVGDGYFISSAPGTGHWSDGTNSIGKTINTSVYGANNMLVSNGDYIIKLYSKYGSLTTADGWRAIECGLNVSFNMEDLSYKYVSIVTNRGKYSKGEILPYLRIKPASVSIALDFRNSGLSFSLKDFLENDVVCNITDLKVANSSIKDQDAATVAAIKTKWPSINIDINPSA